MRCLLYPEVEASTVAATATKRSLMPDILVESRDSASPLPSLGLSRKQIGTVRAVDNLNLTIYRGETLGPMGNGCSKSTWAFCPARH